MNQSNQSHDREDREDMEVDDDHESDKNLTTSDDTDSGASSDEDEGEHIDEEECERRKNEMGNEMVDLEKQFIALKEQLYYERLSLIERQLSEVRCENSLEYKQPFEELQEHKRVREEVADVLRELRVANVQCLYDAESYAAKQNFDMESYQLKDQLKQDLEETLRRLEEDRNSIDSEAWGETTPLKKKRRYNNSHLVDVGPLGRDQLHLPDRRRKPVSVSGPYVVYMLKEQDILEDYHFIRKAATTKSQSCSIYF